MVHSRLELPVVRHEIEHGAAETGEVEHEGREVRYEHLIVLDINVRARHNDARALDIKQSLCIRDYRVELDIEIGVRLFKQLMQLFALEKAREIPKIIGVFEL